jgi:hypothetical protein
MLACLLLTGCHTGTLKDPNDVATAGDQTPKVLRAQLESAADELNLRKARREISDRQYNRLFTKIAQDYLAQVKDKKITKENASDWGEVMIDARDWKGAEPALESAVEAERKPAGQDFHALGDFITDTLKLAQVKAQLGKVPDAVKLVRSVFNVPPKAKVPILTSVLYHIAPAGAGKGDDLELADLIKDSITQHQEAVVDPGTDGGRDFLFARPHHIQRAWEEAAILYASGGRQDLADQAMAQSRQAADSTVHV